MVILLLVCLFLLQLYCTVGISPMGMLSPGKSSWDSHTAQPKAHAGFCSVSIIHQTLTWTRGSLTCMRDFFSHTYAHEGTSVQGLVWLQRKWPTVGVQSLAQNGHPSRWQPSSIVLDHGFCCALLTPPRMRVPTCRTGNHVGMQTVIVRVCWEPCGHADSNS